MKRKVVTCLVATIFFSTVPLVKAQQPTKAPRIGYVSISEAVSTDRNLAALRRGLQDLGYIEGQNILFEYRGAEGRPDRVPGLVAELVQLKVDLLFCPNLPAIEAAKQATKTIPIIMIATSDPVALGLIDSLARPGGNITGITILQRARSHDRLALFVEMVPEISRAAILWNPDTPGPALSFREYETAARARNIELQSAPVWGPSPDFDGAFQIAAKAHANALIVVANTLMNRHQNKIADLAIKHRLPSMNERSDYVGAGGLASYAANPAGRYERAAAYVDRILTGAKPADLPVEQSTDFELVINLKTAKQIGLTIPPNVLARADRVIK